MEKRLHEVTPKQNVYQVPPFFKNYILSNDMIYIIVKLLHQNPQHRFKDLAEVRTEFLQLRDNILNTPVIMRQVLGHPILPSENFYHPNNSQELFKHLNEQISFKNCQINQFALKYMAKFLYSKRVEQLEIHGGSIPLNMIKLENITLLNLSSLGLYSEDLFILSQFLRYNHSITHINL